MERLVPEGIQLLISLERPGINFDGVDRQILWQLVADLLLETNVVDSWLMILGFFETKDGVFRWFRIGYIEYYLPASLDYSHETEGAVILEI